MSDEEKDKLVEEVMNGFDFEQVYCIEYLREKIGRAQRDYPQRDSQSAIRTGAKDAVEVHRHVQVHQASDLAPIQCPASRLHHHGGLFRAGR